MDVASGTQAARGKPVLLKTVQNYVQAAAQFAINQNQRDPRYRYSICGSRLTSTFFPGLADLYGHMKKWRRATRQALPLTSAIIRYLIDQAARDSVSNIFGKSTAIRDGVILGTYTGSRCSEYCRGKRHAGQAFGTTPVSTTTGTFGGWPMALAPSDFTFLSSSLCQIPWLQAETHASYIRVRFRYDKGGSCNFSERTFRRLQDLDALSQFLCPVATGVRILHRWHSISADGMVPVFCYTQSNRGKKLCFLDDQCVTKALRTAVVHVYPDPLHLYRLNIEDVRTHSIRVMALLGLILAQLSDSVIEHKLRWKSTAWKVYIRESFTEIDSTTVKVFKAVFFTDDQHTLSDSGAFCTLADDNV